MLRQRSRQSVKPKKRLKDCVSRLKRPSERGSLRRSALRSSEPSERQQSRLRESATSSSKRSSKRQVLPLTKLSRAVLRSLCRSRRTYRPSQPVWVD